MARNASTQKEKKRVWKPFLKLIKDAKIPWLWILIVFIWSFIDAQLYLMFPDATADIVAGDVSARAITRVVVILFVSTFATSIGQFLVKITNARVSLSLRKFMVRKTLRLPVPYYDKNMADQLISRTTTDTTLISDFMSNSVPYFPSTIYRFIATGVILFTYDWRLVLLEMLMIPVVVIPLIISGKISYKWTKVIQGKLATLTGYLAETLANVPLMKVFVREKRENEKGKENIEQLYNTKKRYIWASSAVSFMLSSQSLIQTVICVVGGAMMVSAEYITLDQWIAFYLYTYGLLAPIYTITSFWTSLKTAQGALSRVSEVADEKPEDEGGSLNVENSGELKFENVSFAYTDENVLQNLTFSIPKNKTTALVGKSGAGKSTIFGLIERFYTPNSGKILLDGTDAAEYSLTNWRQAIGYVPQDAQLFSGSIRFNMTYGLEREVPEEELIAAAKNANAYDFIMGLENGFDTEVGERGSKLSGGQCQRIAIARALLKDPKILLLDEATSSLDAEAAHEVEEAFARLKQGRTTIVIAHELASVRDADQIVVLENKMISASGTHEKLEKESELYRTLLEKQSTPVAMQ